MCESPSPGSPAGPLAGLPPQLHRHLLSRPTCHSLPPAGFTRACSAATPSVPPPNRDAARPQIAPGLDTRSLQLVLLVSLLSRRRLEKRGVWLSACCCCCCCCCSLCPPFFAHAVQHTSSYARAHAHAYRHTHTHSRRTNCGTSALSPPFYLCRRPTARPPSLLACSSTLPRSVLHFISPSTPASPAALSFRCYPVTSSALFPIIRSPSSHTSSCASPSFPSLLYHTPTATAHCRPVLLATLLVHPLLLILGWSREATGHDPRHGHSTHVSLFPVSLGQDLVLFRDHCAPPITTYSQRYSLLLFLSPFFAPISPLPHVPRPLMWQPFKRKD